MHSRDSGSKFSSEFGSFGANGQATDKKHGTNLARMQNFKNIKTAVYYRYIFPYVYVFPCSNNKLGTFFISGKYLELDLDII